MVGHVQIEGVGVDHLDDGAGVLGEVDIDGVLELGAVTAVPDADRRGGRIGRKTGVWGGPRPGAEGASA